MEIGDKIRSIRLMKGFSQENLADMLGISLLTYGDIERNKRDITMKRIEQIAEKLGVSMEDILLHADKVASFFQCRSDINIKQNKKNQDVNYYDPKELFYQIELQKLEIEKLKVERDKAEIEAKYWREKAKRDC
jgi:transcriptional regulator with XRE-family HTH domain